MVNRYQKHHVGHTFTFCEHAFLYKFVIRIFFHYSKLKNSMEMTLITNGDKYAIFLGDSTISRLNGHAKTWFDMVQTYHSVVECEPDKIISGCCFRCPKFLVCYILIFDLYVLAFKKDV